MERAVKNLFVICTNRKGWAEMGNISEQLISCHYKMLNLNPSQGQIQKMKMLTKVLLMNSALLAVPRYGYPWEFVEF